MFCKYCGKPIDETTMRCRICGRPVGTLEGGNGFWDLTGEKPAQPAAVDETALQELREQVESLRAEVQELRVRPAAKKHGAGVLAALLALLALAVGVFALFQLRGLAGSLEELKTGGSGQTGTGSTTTAADIATAESGVSVTTAQYAWWGKVAMVRLVVRKTAAVSSGTTSLCTLAAGKRPKYNTGAVCLTSGLIAQVLSSGRVQVTGSISAGASLTILSTYVLA